MRKMMERQDNSIAQLKAQIKKLQTLNPPLSTSAKTPDVSVDSSSANEVELTDQSASSSVNSKFTVELQGEKLVGLGVLVDGAS